MRLALLLAAATLAGCREAPPPDLAFAATAATAAAPRPTPVPEPYEAPIDVPIGELLTEYKANEIRADGRWKGKILRTSGVVGQVGKDMRGAPFITIGTGARFEVPSLQCFLADAADPEALALSVGAKAVTEGRVEHLLGNVVARGCVVNPSARLCAKLKEATGALECSRYGREPTGDVTAIVFDGDAKRDNALLGLFARETSADDYAWMVKNYADEPKRGTLVGSARTFRYVVLSVVGKKLAYSEELRAKIAAFFDAL